MCLLFFISPPPPPKLRTCSLRQGLLAGFILVSTRLRSVYSGLTSRITNVIQNDDGTVETMDDVHVLVATLIFLTALVFNVNAALWSLHKTRLRLNFQVAYISAVAGRGCPSHALRPTSFSLRFPTRLSPPGYPPAFFLFFFSSSCCKEGVAPCHESK